jgi:predicted metal-dependent phosphoesterase TrpH
LKQHADFHSHSHYSRDSVLSPAALIEACVRKGITCIAVTDHNAVDGAFVIQKRAPFKVIIGEEVKTAEGEIVGLFLKELVPAGLSPEETIRCIHEQGGIVTVPHPYDAFRRSVITRAALGRIVDQVDAIEGYNCRNILSVHDRAARDLAGEHDKPITAGSDAHSRWEVGGVYLEMDDFETPRECLAALRSAEVVFHRSLPMVHWISTYAKVRWRLGLRPGYAS